MTAPRLTGTQWLICVIAAIGFAFDIYELLMLPLILRPALHGADRRGAGHSPDFRCWVGTLFYVPAFVGRHLRPARRLSDRPPRPPPRADLEHPALRLLGLLRRLLARRIWMLLVLRCTTFIGVCVEFVAAVAWLAELFPTSQAAREGARLTRRRSRPSAGCWWRSPTAWP